MNLPNTEPLPPVSGGSLTELRDLLNVTDESWARIVPWLVTGLLPDIPRPLLLLTGGPCSGKSLTARMLAHLLDAGVVPFGRLPHNEDAWQAAQAGAVAVFDNVTRIPDETSDRLCRAVTGGTTVRRPLYTDTPVTVEEPSRAVILAGTIAPDELRADLVDRTVVVELEHITAPRPESALWEAFTEARPRILGALLDLLVVVLGKLPALREKADRGEIPAHRLVDHALVIVALEEAVPSAGA
ncbi:hypothetical protein [Streptomyces melanogenes]|uniref:hypothetical protein n=1 Tax=Streptomyces melanogenes TaxID=67326 RepID=UPI00167E7607|nr:hypothetical protein [Streptomyces melanogenes]GGP93535.1 hypothetical protein GCM10010278_84520 [Streptomyces melanogenes]